MKPHFSTLMNNFSGTGEVSQPELFNEIGWSDLLGNLNYTDTCAIRMSLALIKTGIRLPGRMKIRGGKLAGRLIEPGHAKLCKILEGPAFFGKPEILKSSDAEERIGNRTGVISFWRIGHGPGGHIDLVISRTNWRLNCGSHCYFNSDIVWFWELR
jgi:hypothetical protein